jgi:hypothetical protein
MILRELRKPLLEGKMTDDEIYGMLYHMVSKQGKDAKEVIKYIKGLKDPEYQQRQVGRQSFHDWVKTAQKGEQQSGKAFGRKVLVQILESKILTEDRISNLLIDLGLNSDQVKDVFQKFGLNNNTIDVGILNKIKSFFDRKEPTDRDIAIKAADRDLASLGKKREDLRGKRKTQYDSDLDETGLGEKKDVPKIKMDLSERYDFRQFLEKVGLMDKINSLGLRIEDAKELFGDLKPRLYAKFSELRNSDNYPYNVGEEIDSIEQGLDKFIRRFGGVKEEELDLEEDDLPDEFPEIKEIPPQEAAEELGKKIGEPESEGPVDPTQGVFEKFEDPGSKESINKRKREMEEKVEVENGLSFKPFMLEKLANSFNKGNVTRFVMDTYSLNDKKKGIDEIFDFIENKLSLDRFQRVDLAQAKKALKNNDLKGSLYDVPMPEDVNINRELLGETMIDLTANKLKKFMIDTYRRNGSKGDNMIKIDRYLKKVMKKLKSEGQDIDNMEYKEGLVLFEKWVNGDEDEENKEAEE